MKRIIIALMLTLGVSQAFAAQTYDQKYREALEKHLEVSGTTRYVEQMMGVVLGTSAKQKSKDVDRAIEALPELLVVILEPSYKKHVTLKELRRYNRLLSRRTARRFREARPAIIGDVILNADELGRKLDDYLDSMLEKNTALTEEE